MASSVNQGHKTDEEYFDLGTYRRDIASKDEQCRTWFHCGLLWTYAFNHEEAIECFLKATKHDENCLIAYFGVAYCRGPNYNKPWEVFDEDEVKRNLTEARNAIKTAQERASSNPSDVEKALINAIQHRYEESTTDRSKWNADYATAMAQVYHHFGTDLDIAALYADSLMNLTPWSLWDLRTGKPTPGSRTLEAKAVLETAIAQAGGDQHPGLLHLYIHLMEMSSSPETALPVANKLRSLVPDAGHLHHMPTHLDVLCGDYQAVVTSNSDAIRADERWVAKRGALHFYTLYRAHNYHFRIYGAMFAGISRVALQTAAELEHALPDELLRVTSPPMADWLEGFLSMRLHVLVRFGMWEDVLGLEFPGDEGMYCVTTAMLHYARGVAYANTGEEEKALQEREQFEEAVEKVPESRTLFNNTCVDLLKVAKKILIGETEYFAGNVAVAFDALKEAIRLSDELPYDEPWGWMQPPRHTYGALLLEQGRVEEALAMYKADLGVDGTLPRALRHPNNAWALHGYHECLEKLGQESEAREVKKQLDAVMKSTDVPVKSSCACRRTKPATAPSGPDGIRPWRFNEEKG